MNTRSVDRIRKGFTTVHGLKGRAAYTGDVTKKLQGTGTMEKLLCFTSEQEMDNSSSQILAHICPELQEVRVHTGHHQGSFASVSLSVCLPPYCHWLFIFALCICICIYICIHTHTYTYIQCKDQKLVGVETVRKRHLLPPIAWWSLFPLCLSLQLRSQLL